MARSFLCIKCNVEFPTDAIYIAHKKGGHTDLSQATPLDTPPLPTPPPGIPQEALPSKEFMDTVARIEGQKDVPPVKNDSAPSQHPSELPKAEPIKLTYQFLGECPDHRRPVSTLELDVDKKHFCIAYCPTGNHQIETREAVKL